MPGLRVIAGKAKGRRLYSVPGDATRPITDRSKAALFDIIGMDVAGASFLDLFAGTGSVGIEALSRGAAFARFLEIDRLALKTLRRNLELTGLSSQAEVLRLDALKMLGQPPDREFDYAFIAPPQYKGMWLKALDSLDRQPGWLAADAWVIAQIHPVEYAAPPVQCLLEFDQRKYGSVLFVFYAIKP